MQGKYRYSNFCNKHYHFFNSSDIFLQQLHYQTHIDIRIGIFDTNVFLASNWSILYS